MKLLKLLWPLSKRKKQDLKILKNFLDPKDHKLVKKLMKLGEVGIAYSSLKVSKKLTLDHAYPTINPGIEDPELLKKANIWNSSIEQAVREKTYKSFADQAEEKLKKFIAPHIIGMDDVREAVLLQLFCEEKTHILLLGDPSTGKTDFLRAASELAPISSFGLGSGTSGVGLTGTFKGQELIKGLLPMADNGIACIDELNLMKPRDRGSLLNAMEKGFVSYDKGNKHLKLDARVSVLATANPKGDRFVGRTKDTWLKQIPFDPALISRFHIVFFIRKFGTEQFKNIAKQIVNQEHLNMEINDYLFIRDYIEFSRLVEVSFNDNLKKQIVDFAAKLKKDEPEFLVEVTPRLILGIVRFTKASARMELRKTVIQSDLDKIFKLFENALYIKK